MPVAASSSAPAVDGIFYFIFWLSAFFFLVIVGVAGAFVWRYRASRGATAQASPRHSTLLEVTWSGIPLLLVLGIFVWGFRVYLDMSTAPANAYEVLVTGQKWKWLFTYPNGHVDGDLHVPIDVPVKLVITSEDVIHSLYVPAFRIKKDAVPGRYTSLWFRAIAAGEYQVFCAEYCGTSHSDMLARVVVHPPGEFERWLVQAADFLRTLPPAEAGAKLFQVRGCAQCHSIDGAAATGPTLLRLFGSRVPLQGGEIVAADENYVRMSILDPSSQVVAGFEAVMPTFAGRLKDQEITALIAYLKTLQ